MVKICKISSKNDAHRLSGKRARASVLRAHPPLCASSPHRCSDASVCPASVARQATLFTDVRMVIRMVIQMVILYGNGVLKGPQFFENFGKKGVYQWHAGK